MSRLIQQRTDFDCGACALAMATRKSYHDILSDIGEQAQNIGMTANETVLYLWRIGHKPTYFMTEEAVSECDPQALQRVNISHIDIATTLIEQKKRAILTVMTPTGGLHAVFFDGIEVLCPRNGVMGKGYFERYTIMEAILLHDY